MNNDDLPAARTDGPLSRRTILQGIGWSVPLITIAAAPALGVGSDVPNKGLDGWVYLNGGDLNTFWIDMKPDSGSPPYGIWGFWVKNGTTTDTISSATLTFDFSQNVGPFTASGSGSSSWSGLSYVGTVVVGGQTYYRYVTTFTANSWAYNTTVSGMAAQYSRFEFTGGTQSGNLTVRLTRSVTVNGNVITFTRVVNL